MVDLVGSVSIIKMSNNVGMAQADVRAADFGSFEKYNLDGLKMTTTNSDANW